MNDSQKRILIIAASLPPSPCGIADFTHKLAGKLSERNLTIRVVISKQSSLKNIHLSVDAVMDRWAVTDLFKLEHIIARFKPHTVVFQSTGIGYPRFSLRFLYPAFIRKKHPQIKILYVLHEFKSLSLSGKIETLVSCLFSNKILTNNVLSHRFPFIKKTHFVQTPSHISVRFEALNKDSGVPTAVFFGYLDPFKGIDLLLKAFHELREKDVYLHLNIIGKDRSRTLKYRTYLESLRKKWKMQNYVKFFGHLPEDHVSYIFQKSDFGILPFRCGVSPKSGSLAALIEHNLPTIITVKNEDLKANIPEGILKIKPDNIETLKEAIKMFVSESHTFKANLIEYKKRNPTNKWNALIDAII